MFISLIRAYYAVRVDTSEKSESAASESDQPKAEALTLLIQKRVPLRPNVKVIERRDDVVVIHKNARSKRKQTTRARRRPSNQFRSKIRPSSGGGGNSNNFGGFKDFSSNDLRFPPFPSKPPRASNKLKYSSGSSKRTPSYDFNSQPKPRPPRPSQVVKTISTVYGPPATQFNQLDSFNAPVTLQQAQNSFPTFSVETIEPIQQNFFSGNKNFGNDFGGNKNFGNDFGGGVKNYNNDFGGNKNFDSDFGSTNNFRGNNKYANQDDFGQGNRNPGGHGSFNSNINFGNNNNNFPSHNEVNRFSSSSSINNFPLGEGSSFNVPKTSYGEPVRSASSQSTSSYQFNSIAANQQNNNKYNGNNAGNNFPKLPSRYETSDFTTPTRHNPLHANNFDLGNLDVLSETKNVLASIPGNVNRGKNRFNKFNNFDYEFGVKDYDDEDDDDDESSDFIYTTRKPQFRFTPPTTTTTTTPFPTTTKRSKKGVYGKRKRPAKVPQSHNLDTDELRDAFTEASNDDFQEVKLHSDDYLNFDSMRNVKKGSQTPFHEIHSTLKAARKNPALRQALGDDFQIVSIEKSLEQNPQNVDLSGFRLQRREDEEGNQQYQEFRVGSEINFSNGASNPNTWNGDIDSFPRNHRFSK